MSLFLLVNREDALIDSYGQRVSSVAPTVTQSDNPGEDVQPLWGNPTRPELPNPSIGGQMGSGIRNGFSTGFQSFFTRTQRFNGATASAPPITNPVQGEVGKSNLAGRRYAGVMSQLVSYTPSLQSTAAAWVGILPAKDVKP